MASGDTECGRQMMNHSDDELVGMLFQHNIESESIKAVLQIRQAKATNRLTIVGIILAAVMAASAVLQAMAIIKGM